MSVTVTKNFDLGKINLDVHKELNLVGGIIKKDHYQRLESGQGINGKMQSLAPSTIKRKGHSKILVDSGKMRNLIVGKATKTNQQVVIHPGTSNYPKSDVSMDEVGEFHQKGTKHLPKREWFGITDKVEKDALRLIEARIEREIQNA